jgi:hypothetical protein
MIAFIAVMEVSGAHVSVVEPSRHPALVPQADFIPHSLNIGRMTFGAVHCGIAWPIDNRKVHKSEI